MTISNGIRKNLVIAKFSEKWANSYFSGFCFSPIRHYEILSFRKGWISASWKAKSKPRKWNPENREKQDSLENLENLATWISDSGFLESRKVGIWETRIWNPAWLFHFLESLSFFLWLWLFSAIQPSGKAEKRKSGSPFRDSGFHFSAFPDGWRPRKSGSQSRFLVSRLLDSKIFSGFSSSWESHEAMILMAPRESLSQFSPHVLEEKMI